MKVTINSAHFAATWHWSVPPDEVCGICRVPFDGCCPECSIPGDECPLIWGKCTHVYHLHCILRWINSENSKGQCPLDRQPWGRGISKLYHHVQRLIRLTVTAT